MLRVPERVYNRRLERMKLLIENKAPRIIIYHEARLILKGYQPSFWHRVSTWLTDTRIGYALFLLLDGEWWKWKLTGKSDVYAPEPWFTDPESMARFLKDIANTEPLSYDAETADLNRADRVLTEDFFDEDSPKEHEPLPENTTVGQVSTLPCGHTSDNWYSICSAHHGAYQDADCPRCKVGRCIKCFPTMTDREGYAQFFNRDDGTKANPFPNLGKCKNPDNL